jgi:hypothetical protein
LENNKERDRLQGVVQDIVRFDKWPSQDRPTPKRFCLLLTAQKKEFGSLLKEHIGATVVAGETIFRFRGWGGFLLAQGEA